jgi:hypothetical protein
MIGKAVFDGYVMDVPLALFFLRRILGHASGLDELATLDADLYRQLLTVKTYEGDLDDLALTMSTMETVLGQVVAVDLVPGGSAVAVTRGAMQMSSRWELSRLTESSRQRIDCSTCISWPTTASTAARQGKPR